MPIDEEVKDALDARILGWSDVTPRRMFGGASYMVGGRMFAVLSEGVVGMKLGDELRARALTLAGVSPFRPTGRPFGRWVQFLLLLAEDVPNVVPWLEEAHRYVAAEPPKGAKGTR